MCDSTAERANLPPVGVAGSRKQRAQFNRCVLLVDDDELVQVAMGELLAFLGYEPMVFCCGEDALEALGKGMEPRLAILDLDMPGIGGAGTLTAIRALRPDLPILVCSASADLDDPRVLRGQARLALLQKPFSVEDLQKHLDG